MVAVGRILFLVMAFTLLSGFIFWIAAAAVYDEDTEYGGGASSFWMSHNSTVSGLQSTAYALFGLTVALLVAALVVVSAKK